MRLIADSHEFGSVGDAVCDRLMASGIAASDVAIEILGAGMLEFRTTGDHRVQLQAASEGLDPVVASLVSDHAPAIPQLLVSDMDSTMIGQECIDELADYAGVKGKIADITERAMQGELDFESALRERVALLAGLDESAISQCLDERISASPGAQMLVQTLKAHGCRCVLVTGGFHHFADAVGQELGFDRVVGNRLEVANGRLTGQLVGSITDASTKRAVLHEEAAALGEGALTLATGDGANDIPMLQAADYGFAYRAKPKARAAANGRVDGVELTSILTLFGIGKSDWLA